MRSLDNMFIHTSVYAFSKRFRQSMYQRKNACINKLDALSVIYILRYFDKT